MKLTESTLRKIVKRLVREGWDSNKTLTRTQIEDMLLQHAEGFLDGASGFEADLSGYNLSGMDLTRLYFDSLHAQGANFSNANLSGATFVQVNCRGADFRGADLSEANLDSVDLREAKFTTEFTAASSLINVVCDDEQLPYLIAHPGFSRQLSDYIGI